MLTNAKLEKFARHFSETGSISGAAAAAGFSRHLAARGSDLLKRADVAARVRELVADRLTSRGELSPQVVRHLPSLAHRLDADTLHRAAQAVAFLASLA
jgi:hypothetical protein